MKRLLTTALLALMPMSAFASVGAIKVCDNVTLTANTTTNCDIVELPASRNFSYQVYCGETDGDSMSVDVDFVNGSSRTALAVPSGLTQLKTAYTAEDAWSATAQITTPIATFGTIQFTENNNESDIVCSAILNVGEASQLGDDTVLTGDTVLQGGAVIGETLGPELAPTTCAGYTYAAPWSCTDAPLTFTRTAAATDLDVVPTGVTTAIGSIYKVSQTLTGTNGGTLVTYIGSINAGASAGTKTANASYTDYVSAVAAGAITVRAGTTVAVTLTGFSIRAVTSAITPASGPVAVYKDFSSATANESALVVTGNQTGAAGDKSVIMANFVGTAGSGAEYLYVGKNVGTQTFGVTAAGAVAGHTFAHYSGNTVSFGFASPYRVVTVATITAAVSSVQGGSPLTATYNEISTCANAGDAVTLPAAAVGYHVRITNHGAASADVFPASGDAINEATANDAKALAADATLDCYAYDSTNWECNTLAR